MQYESSYRGTVSMLSQSEWRSTRRAGRAEPERLPDLHALRGGGAGMAATKVALVEIEEQDPERWDGLA